MTKSPGKSLKVTNLPDEKGQSLICSIGTNLGIKGLNVTIFYLVFLNTVLTQWTHLCQIGS